MCNVFVYVNSEKMTDKSVYVKTSPKQVDS